MDPMLFDIRSHHTHKIPRKSDIITNVPVSHIQAKPEIQVALLGDLRQRLPPGSG